MPFLIDSAAAIAPESSILLRFLHDQQPRFFAFPYAGYQETGGLMAGQ